MSSSSQLNSSEDLISGLPDDILQFILSRLTIEESANTIVLSNRWRNLWKHATTLNFQHNLRSENIGFMKEEACKFKSLVNSVLQLNRAPILDKLIVCSDFAEYVKMDSADMLLDFAFAKRIKMLELEFIAYTHHKSLPLDPDASGNRFNDLIAGGVEVKLEHLYNSVDLSLLKELSLTGIIMTDEVVNSLILKCCNLERFTVVGTYELNDVVVNSSSLIYLNMSFADRLRSIKICCPRLVTLKLQYPDEIMTTNIPKLTEAHVYGPFSPPDNGIFRVFSQLEVLLLHDIFTKSLEDFTGFPVMNRLKVLIINVGAFGDIGLIGLTYFMTACPNLEKFVLQLFWRDPERTERQVEKIKRPLNMKHLKVVEVSGYYGRTCEDELILCLLENVVAVEKLIIDPRNNNSIVGVPQFHDIEEETAARTCARRRLPELVPKHVELIIL